MWAFAAQQGMAFIGQELSGQESCVLKLQILSFNPVF